MSTGRLVDDLTRAGVRDATDAPAVLAAYSSDGSLYRVPPKAVTFPRSADEVAAVLDVAVKHDVPVTCRGGGTSVAGNAIGPGIVVDFSRHMSGIGEVANGTVRVEPGVVQAALQRAVAPTGLRFGPDPSTSSRCTIGGMIGNDACGPRSLAYGRTADNVVAATWLLADGSRLTTDSAGAATGTDAAGNSALVHNLRDLVAADLATVRTEFGRFGRQVSGYALHNLLPENGFDLTRAMVGSEGTLGILLDATVRLVPAPAHKRMVVLAFGTYPDAGYAVPEVLKYKPSACEGLDHRIVEVVRNSPDLPSGKAWLFVEISGDDEGDVRDRAAMLAAAANGLIVTNQAEADRLWRIREDGAGLSGRAPSGKPAHSGWEDSAVPPDRMGAYLEAFDELLTDHGLTAMPYGHFGEGCLHVRIDYTPGEHRAFIEAAADLVASLGGSLSGEHGDGRARSELLPRMYSERAMALMRAVKHTFDPHGRLNPGILVDPQPMSAGVRLAGPVAVGRQLAFRYSADAGELAQSLHRCTGVGKCRADNSATGGVMCPSYAVTKDEIHSTRGRARILQEMVNGDSALTWNSPAVHEALDLCLACKGCASDCPTGVDVATYKAEVLHQTYRRRLRPRSHYSLGWLPRWSRLASLVPGLANRTGRLMLGLAGVDKRRSIPTFARSTFRRRFKPSSTGTEVVLFVDSFTNHFQPEVADAAVTVLRAAGYAPRITRETECCGLTWITTGQLDAAARRLGSMVAALAPAARRGVPIVGIEPSCTAVLRHETVELLGTADAGEVAAATRTLAELLAETPGWKPPDLTGHRVVAQPHCHHHAVLGWEADRKLLESTGAQVEAVPGCCGMAGNFGVEQGHYEVSVAIAERHLLPAVRTADAETILLVDGFSCRTQLADLAPEAKPLHLAQLLSRA